MSWFDRIAKKSLLDEIRSWGWSEDQLKLDAVGIYKRNSDFFVSLGDWAKVNVDDVKGSINRVYPDSNISYEFEGGPEGDGWERIL